ncbi:MFS transporter [Rhodococcus opacus]|nr:MFS transporter [Rhodococcus opacus]
MICSYMQTLVVPLVPEWPRLLSTSSINASWILTATLLGGAVCMPISGRLGDIFGKRRIAIFLLAGIALGSLLSAVSSSLAPMIVGRTLQGAGLGVIPLGISMLRDSLPFDRLGRSVALMSSTLGVGAAVGIPLSATVSQHHDWHWLFWAAMALSIVGAIALWIVVPASPQHRGTRFDGFGAIGLALGLSGVLLAIAKGADWGWTDRSSLGCAVGGLVVLLFWGFYQWKVTSPLVDLRVCTRRPVLLANLASIAIAFGGFVPSVALPRLLQMQSTTGVGLGQSMVVSSMSLVSTGVVMMAISPLAARLVTVRGPRTTLICGAVAIILAYVFACLFMTEMWHTVVVGALVGVGTGLGYSSLPTVIMDSVPDGETASANGLNMLMRSIGTSTASAVAAALMAHNVVTVGSDDFTTAMGFRFVFALAGSAGCVALLLVWFLPRQPRVHRRRVEAVSVPAADA